MYEARTRVVGGVPVLVPMRDEQDHDLTGIIGAVTERTKVIFLCSPNNPTGNKIPEEALRRILRLGIPTVIDEAYVELGDGLTYSGIVHEYANAIVLRTFSKAYGLAGLRLGYLFARPSIVALFERVKVPWSISALTIAAASAALDDTIEFQARVRELQRSRGALVDGLSKIHGILAIPSEGNFVLADISSLGVSAERFVAEAQKEGFLLRSLAVHHANRSYVRITVGTPEQNAQCLLAMDRVAKRVSNPIANTFGIWTSVGDAE
jgi:histidinol-phosphate aminotransferase